jgi:hypothetical protein
MATASLVEKDGLGVFVFVFNQLRESLVSR